MVSSSILKRFVFILLCWGVSAWAQWESECQNLLKMPMFHSAVSAVALTEGEARALGWVADRGLCRGHFQVTPVGRSVSSALTLDTQAPVHVNTQGLSYWPGEVTLHWRGRVIQTHALCVWTDPHRRQVLALRTQHRFRYQEGQLLAWAESLMMNARSQVMDAHHAVWRWVGHWRHQHRPWWGRAEGLHQDHERLTLKHTMLSACQPRNPAWWLQASRLTLDPQTGLGQAKHVTLRVAGIPVFYWPYWLFPVDGKRHSGLLMPRVAHSEASGWLWRFPVYWNVAPQTDMLLTPLWSSRRHAGLDGSWRYLLPVGLHTLEWWQQWHDTAGGVEGKRRRWALLWKERWSGAHWRSHLDWQGVSDAAWLRDFPHRGEALMGPFLPRQWWLAQWGEHWDSEWLGLSFQSLSEGDSAPFRQLPRWRGQWWHTLWGGALRLGVRAEWLHYLRWGPALSQAGQRTTLAPYWQWRHALGVGDVMWRQTLVGLYHHNDAGGQHVVVPETELAWQAVGQRVGRVHGERWQVRVEPKIYFAWIPYRPTMQTLPLVDDSLPLWTVERLFVANRFVGGDRIGDTQRLAVGLRHRWLRLRDGTVWQMQVGQGYDRQVPRLGLVEPWQAQDAGHDGHWSPLVFSASYRHPDQWMGQGTVAYGWQQHRLEQWQFRWQHFAQPGVWWPKSQVAILVDQTASPQPLRQLEMSLEQPWFGHWSWEGLMRYDVRQHQLDNASWGVRYRRCGWSLGLVQTYERFTDDRLGPQGLHRAWYLRWSLDGLGQIGHLPTGDGSFA